VCENTYQQPVRDLIKRLFELDFVKGPFTSDFEATHIGNSAFENIGYIEVDNKKVPFKTFNIPEDGEGGSNWLDICIYTAMYEKILGHEYITWDTNAKWYEGIDQLLTQILNELNQVYPIRIGVLGFEISGMYYLQTLKEKELTEQDISYTKFFVNKEETLKGNNWEVVTQLTRK
ncbi:MAG: hypothetical protein AAGI23_08915, partial [Bacteroidota bacterium]